MLQRRAGWKAVRHLHDTLSPDTLLPFLYHTKTIQQRPYTQVSRGKRTSHRSGNGAERQVIGDRGDIRRGGRPSPKRANHKTDVAFTPLDLHGNAHIGNGDEQTEYSGVPYRKPWVDHVPFERGPGEIQPEFEGSTITPREQKAFEKLFELKKEQTAVVAPVSGSVKKRPNRQHSLDSILDSALANIKQGQRPPPKFPQALRPLAEEARDNQRLSRQTAVNSEEVARQQAISAELTRINALLDNAKTDIELWRTLETHVLNRVVALELDPITTAKQRVAVQAWLETKASFVQGQQPRTKLPKYNPAEQPILNSSLGERELLTANFPLHLLHFMRSIMDDFPASPHGLYLLPTLKAFGPSVFAMGATTALYNAHVRIMYSKFPLAVQDIIDVLKEMDKQVYEFDEGTMDVIVKILRDAQKFGARGLAGPGVQALWQTESAKRGLKALLHWRDVVEERMQEAALRKAREEEVAEREKMGESVDGVQHA